MGLFSNVTNWYFSKKSLPYWCILLLDCFIVVLAGLVGNYIVLGGNGIASGFWKLVAGLLVSLIPFAISFRCLHTYAGIIRYSSFIDLGRVALANACGALGTWLISFVKYVYDCPAVMMPSPLAIAYMCIIATMLMWLERIFVKLLFEQFHLGNAESTVIYGTKAGGIALAKNIRSQKDKKYLLKAFISDGSEMKNAYLLGCPVYLNEKGVAKKLADKGVKVLLVSPLKTEMFRNNQEMVSEFIEAGFKIMMMQKAEEWDGKSDIKSSQIKEVDIEDLLPREKIEVDMEAIGAMLQGKRILITGAAGSIGSEMARQVAKFAPSELVLIDQAETPMHDVRLYMAANHPDITCLTIVSSITDQAHMEKIFAEHKPEYVFHAAAYKHVPMMEDNPGQAIRNNVYGTRVIADLAVKYGTRKFVMISTDKAVNPTNVMGCSKRICEIYCQALNAKLWAETQKTGVPSTQFITTRFGNVLGSNGSVIPIFKEQIKRGGPVKVTHPDIIRYFMLIPEACRLVLEAGTMGRGGEIFIFDMGEPVKIVDLAKRMIALSGAKDVEIVFTGLRDGEKLYEELLASKENTVPTVHPKIMVAQVREYPYETALKNEIDLYNLSNGFDDMAIVAKMKQIVPEFKSRHSKYEILDKD